MDTATKPSRGTKTKTCTKRQGHTHEPHDNEKHKRKGSTDMAKNGIFNDDDGHVGTNHTNHDTAKQPI